MRSIKLRIAAATMLFSVHSFAQQSKELSLDQVQSQARDNFPLLKQKQLYIDIANDKSGELSSNFLPQITLAGQATYQSEVTEFSLPSVSGFKQLPDQYAVGLELKENLFDYGMIKTQKTIEQQTGSIQAAQVESDLIKLKERINQLYGNIYLQQENKKIQLLRIAELDSKRKKMQSAVNNGAALESNFLVLESEYLSTQQKMEEINSNLLAWFSALSILTNQAYDTTTVLSDQVKSQVLQEKSIRPELNLFDLQGTNLSLREKMINRNNLPRLFVFGRGYYGRPGYNFLNNDFRPYGMVGLGLNWSISSYYTASKEKNSLHLNSELVDLQKKQFELNLQSQLVQQKEEINKLEKMIVLDEQIVETKTKIRKASSSQLDNGIITSSDFIVDLNAENQAMYNLKLHKIQLMMARENYNTSLGY